MIAVVGTIGIAALPGQRSEVGVVDPLKIDNEQTDLSNLQEAARARVEETECKQTLQCTKR